MNATTIVDTAALIDDLRIATAYASRAGLLHKKHVCETLKSAEQTLSKDESPDIAQLTAALNEVAKIISPMTLADLRFGRDPFTAANQGKARVLQFRLALSALILLALIADYTHALRTEQVAVQALHTVDGMRARQKVTELRLMAQYEGQPLDKNNAFSVAFHQQLAEWRDIGVRLDLSVQPAERALATSLIPLARLFSASQRSEEKEMTEPERAEEDAKKAQEDPMAEEAKKVEKVESTSTLCEVTDGKLELPEGADALSEYMRYVYRDWLHDYCFQLMVLIPMSSFVGSPFIPSLIETRLFELTKNIPLIESKISIRTKWILPFAFGVLGSIVFVMRNVASVRTPALDYVPMLLRLSLGGVAGIVIGWFSFAAVPALESAFAISVPFALAFLTGYGIDVLFSGLDRLNRAVVKPAGQQS